MHWFVSKDPNLGWTNYHACQRRETSESKVYLDWLFIFVLAVALLNDPCARQAAISWDELTTTSVNPASVIAPFDVSRICSRCLPWVFILTAYPFEASNLLKDAESNKSLTSSFRIWKFKTFTLSFVIQITVTGKSLVYENIEFTAIKRRKKIQWIPF